jgi:hypothetical protein
MKWLVALLLLANFIYFGWELDRETEQDIKNTIVVRNIPSDAKELELITKSSSENLVIKPISPINTIDPSPMPVNSDSGEARDQGSELLDSQFVVNLPDIDLSVSNTNIENLLCFTFGPLAEEIMAQGLRDWFNTRRAVNHVRETVESGEQLFWIYLAPEVSRSLALDTIRELRDKGIADFRIINRGNLENAISLGVFSSQAAVNNRLGELEQKGLNPVVVPYYNEKKLYWIDVQLGSGIIENGALFESFPSRYNYIPVDCDKISGSSTAF